MPPQDRTSRLRRTAFGFAALASACLLLVTAAVWVWSSVDGKEWHFERDGRVWNVGLRGGHVWATSVEGWPAGKLTPGLRVYFFPQRGYSAWGAVGAWGDSGTADAAASDGSFRVRGPYFNVALMFWAPFALFALLPAAWLGLRLRSAYRRRRAKSGACVHCGYDLRGNVSGVCPECGTPIPAGAAA